MTGVVGLGFHVFLCCCVFQTFEIISHHQIKSFKYIVTRTHNSAQQQNKWYQNVKGVC